MTMMSDASGTLSCVVLGLVVQHPVLLVVPLAATLWLAYRLTHPPLVPGQAGTLTLLLPGAEQSHPYAATLSPFSHLRARWALRCYARSRGFKNGRELAQQLRDDEDFDWAGGEKPKRGDFVRGWDRVMVWDEDCIDLVVLESWRSLSDPLSDDALQSALRRGPSDVMLQIAEHKIECDADKSVPRHSPLLDFWEAIDRRPPRGCGAVGLEWYNERGMLSTEEFNQRAHSDIDETFSGFSSWKSAPSDERASDEELQEEARILKRGKEMFYRYGPPILVGLMQVGLSGGFASPRITDVLKATGYLMSAQKKGKRDAKQSLQDHVDLMQTELDKARQGGKHSTLPSHATSERTFRRLLETMSFVLDVMETDDSLFPPSQHGEAARAASGQELLEKGGSGWLSCCRVRFIHTSVRRRLSPTGTLRESYPASSGVAINQEDLLATLTSFSIAPLYTLQRMGISPSPQERKDYVALWRHVGFYMGIEPHLLQRVFRDVDSAERFFCCVASHHFLGVTQFKRLPSPPPISTHFGRDLEEVKRFDFDKGPALPLLYSVARRPPGNMNFSMLCCMSRYLLGNALANAVSLPSITRRQYFGIRLRLFVLAYPPLFARYYPRRRFGDDLGENCKGLLRRVIIWSMKGERVSFESDREVKAGKEAKIDIGVQEGIRLRRQYFRLMAEMLVVSAALALLAAVGLVWILSSTTDALASLQANHCHCTK